MLRPISLDTKNTATPAPQIRTNKTSIAGINPLLFFRSFTAGAALCFRLLAWDGSAACGISTTGAGATAAAGFSEAVAASRRGGITAGSGFAGAGGGVADGVADDWTGSELGATGAGGGETADCTGTCGIGVWTGAGGGTAWDATGAGGGAAAGTLAGACGTGTVMEIAGGKGAGAADSGAGEVITPLQCGHGPVVGARSRGIRIFPLQ